MQVKSEAASSAPCLQLEIGESGSQEVELICLQLRNLFLSEADLSAEVKTKFTGRFFTSNFNGNTTTLLVANENIEEISKKLPKPHQMIILVDWPERVGRKIIHDLDRFLEGCGIGMQFEKFPALYAESMLPSLVDTPGVWSLPFISGWTGVDLNKIRLFTACPECVQWPKGVVQLCASPFLQ